MKMLPRESVTLLLFTEQVEDRALPRYLIAANIAFVAINYTTRFWRFCVEFTTPPRSVRPRHPPDLQDTSTTLCCKREWVNGLKMDANSPGCVSDA